MMKKRIVVFGATGNLGAYVVADLIDRGFEVIAVGKRESDNCFFEGIGATYYSVDIENPEAFHKLPQEEVYGVAHFAGALPSRYAYNATGLLSSIVLGTKNVLDYMVRTGAKRIVFPQTPFDLYYLHNTDQEMEPDAPRSFPKTGDHSVYTLAKNAAVDLIAHYSATYSLDYYVLRFFTIYQYHPNPYHYGDGVHKKMPYRILIDKAIQGEPITLWGDPTRSKEMVYIKDFTQVVFRCFSMDAPSGIYNVGNEKGVSLEEQIRGIVAVFSPANAPSEIKYDPTKPNALKAKLDITKTVQALGYKQEYSYLAALQDFYKEMKEEPFAKLWGRKEDYE